MTRGDGAYTWPTPPISAVTHEVFSKKSANPTNGAFAPATAAQLVGDP
ncbi:MAG: hypothetical protein WBG53_08980 [Rhodococcus sp. (in: high G+C Gram-positive bacteria)]|nr:hypothetical protein [Rhodococcus sp. BS-15]